MNVTWVTPPGELTDSMAKRSSNAWNLWIRREGREREGGCTFPVTES